MLYRNWIGFFGLALYGLAITISVPKKVTLSDMVMRYEINNHQLDISLSAPTEGWLAVGFNAKNSIHQADLLMFKVENGKVIGEDRYVKGFRDYPSDEAQGGQFNISNLKGSEKNGKTKISFSIPMQSKDIKDFQHQKGKPFWLILAYSNSDDFQHHSTMRKHKLMKW